MTTALRHKAVSYTHLDVYKRQALDWRELYEILSYMVKQPFYCGEDQKRYYQETKQKADRDKMNPCLLYTSRCV